MNYHPRKYSWAHPGANEVEIDLADGGGLLLTIVDGKGRRHYWTTREVDLSITGSALVKMLEAPSVNPYYLLMLVAERLYQQECKP